MSAKFDETMRVSRVEAVPARPLPQRFAPVQTRRWPYLVIAVLGIVACVLAVTLAQRGERSPEAEELLRLLGR